MTWDQLVAFVTGFVIYSSVLGVSSVIALITTRPLFRARYHNHNRDFDQRMGAIESRLDIPR